MSTPILYEKIINNKFPQSEHVIYRETRLTAKALTKKKISMYDFKKVEACAFNKQLSQGSDLVLELQAQMSVRDLLSITNSYTCHSFSEQDTKPPCVRLNQHHPSHNETVPR